MQSTYRFWQKIPVCVSCITGSLLALILFLLIFGQHFFQTAYQNQSLLSNAVLYPFSLAAAGLFYVLSARWKLRKEKQTFIFHASLLIATLGIQFIIARCCWYKMGWDVATVYTSAEEMARGLPISDSSYFKAYPNNAVLTILHFVPLWVAVKVGLGVPFVVLPYIDAVLLNISAWLCYLSVRQLTRNQFAHHFALLLSIGWIALSPYILFPYTDTFSILFPVLAFFLYISISRPVLKWFLISLVCFAGAAIKPTVLIVLIALFLLAICKFLSDHVFLNCSIKQLLLILIVIVLGAVPGKLFENASVYALTGSTNPQEEHGLGYWFLTGMNVETFGGHSVGDVEYANSFSDYNERQTACISKAIKRLSSRSAIENIHFFTTKAYKAYADGSFASQKSFLELEIPPRPDKLSIFLRSLYHKDGQLMPYCQTAAQCLWLGVLTLCAVAAFRQRRNPAVALICLTLLGLTAYLLLFEVWPRYLFLYAPFFVILAAMAFDRPEDVMVK